MTTLEARFSLKRGDFNLEVIFTAPAHGVTALFGPSGSGKTTVLRCLAGLERARGQLSVNGEVWQDDQRRRFLPPHRRAVGYVFQDARLFPHLTVLENLNFGRKRLPQAQRTPLEPVVDQLDIGHLLHRDPSRLSGGEQQRVAIGRALLTNPALLLMDEPLSGLDSQRKQEILPYLQRLHDELSIPMVYVSHDTEEVNRLADHLVLIEGGRVVSSGAANQVLANLNHSPARSENAAVQLETVVAGHEAAHGITRLDFKGGRLHVGTLNLPLGKRVRVQIKAKDVEVALTPPGPMSITSVFPAVVNGLSDRGPLAVIVRMDAEGVPLLARISRQACAALELCEGKAVYALVREATPLSE